MTDVKTSPGLLYMQARDENGPDPEAIGARYRALLRDHGHLLAPGDPGYDQASRTLPCGWPGAKLTGRYVQGADETRAQVERRVRIILKNAAGDPEGGVLADDDEVLAELLAWALAEWVDWAPDGSQPVAEPAEPGPSAEPEPDDPGQSGAAMQPEGKPSGRKPQVRKCAEAGCGGGIVWARTVPGGKPMPVDAGSAGDPTGTLAVWSDAGKLLCRVLKAAKDGQPGEEPGQGEWRGVTHWYTCAKADPPAPVASMKATGWRLNRQRHRWEYIAPHAPDSVIYWMSAVAVGAWTWEEIGARIELWSERTGCDIPPLPDAAKTGEIQP